MAINDIINESWQGHGHGEVEDALKQVLAQLLDAVERIPQGGISIDELSDSLKALINNAVPNTRKVNNKALNSDITLGAADVGALPADTVIPDGVTVDQAMSSTSENAVQNKVIKAYVDNLVNGLINGAPAALDTLKELADALGDNDDAIAALTSAIASKANASDVYTKAQTDQAIEDALDGQGTVKSVTINGMNHTPNSQGIVDLGTIQGEKGEQGDTGNCEITDAGELVTILVNDLTTGGAGNILSAEMGKRLKSKVEEVYQRVQSIYSLLAGIAFKGDKPAASSILPALDWSNPRHIVTFYLTLANVTVMRYGVAVSNGTSLSIEELTSLTLDIVPDTGLSFLSVPTVTFGGNSVTPILNQDGSYSVEVTMPQNDVTLAITAAAMRMVTANTIDCTLDNVGNVGLGGSYSGQLTAASHSTMTDAHVKVTMNGTDVTSTAYNASTGAITISSVTGPIVVEAIAVAPKPTKFLVSGGSSYCDLGFYPKATMSYRCLYKFSSIKTYGGNIAALSKFALPKARSAGGNNWYWQFGTDSGTGVTATINTNTEYEFILFRGGTSSILCNGQVIGTDVVRVDLSDSPYAFTHAGAQTSADASLVGSVLYIEVFDLVNGVDTLIHRFVADTQNGVNGFLDTVTNNFIPSASSTPFTISNRS